MNNTDKPKYLWVRPNSVENPMLIVNDPIEIFRGNQFDKENDKLYKIGPEVELKVSIVEKPVYRNRNFDNHDAQIDYKKLTKIEDEIIKNNRYSK